MTPVRRPIGEELQAVAARHREAGSVDEVRTVRAADWIRLSARNYPDRDCFVTHEGRFSFSVVNERVNRLASALAARGVRPGDRIALFATDSHRYMETLLASMKLGCVFVPLNFRLADRELRTLLRTAEPRCLFWSERYEPMVGRVTPDAPGLSVSVRYEPGMPGDYESLVEEGADVEPDPLVNDEDIVGLAFTSGTTALPKGVLHSQRMIKHLVTQVVMERRLPDAAFHYSAAPLYHVAGMLYVLGCLARSQTSLILPAFDPAEVVRWLQSGEVTGCFFVPTMISSVLEQPGVGDAAYEAMHSIAYGAAPMSPALLRRAMATFDCQFINMFGAGTEAGLQAVLTPEDHLRALAGEEGLLGSIGRPAMGVDLRLVDGDMKDVPRGEVGEIVTRANAVMSGYLGQPDETARTICDGWFRGGDLAWEDEQGFLYLSGRKNDMIIRGGENIYPVEIESVLSESPGVLEAAVVGRPDDHWGEVVRAHVVPRDGATVDPEVLRAHCREHLAAYKVPVEIRIETELPKNASGKILKRELRALP